VQLHLHEWGDPSAPPLICLHGISAHGRRFRKLAEERLAARFHVLAPDLRGHGRSDHDPPWDIPTHLEDLLETIAVERATWIGHSFGGRLLVELAAQRPELIERAILLDPALQILPHVAHDFAGRARQDATFASVEEAVAARAVDAPTTPREFLEEEAREQLVPAPGGLLRLRYCRSAVITAYSELCTAPPAPERMGVPMLLVYAQEFGLVRPEQLDAYAAVPHAELVGVPGGHIVYWDAFDQTADAVERFLAARESARPGPRRRARPRASRSRSPDRGSG
jgi:lipase